MSGAVSSRVPSVIDAGVHRQPRPAGERVVIEAGDVDDCETRCSRPLPQLRRADEFLVRVGTRGQQPQHVLGADDRQRIGFQGAIQRGDENVAPGFDQSTQRRDHGGGIRHVLEHLHAGDDVVFAGVRQGVCLSGLEYVIHGNARFKCVQSRDLQQFVGEIETRHCGTFAGHGFRQQAAAAADVQHLAALQLARTFDVFEPHGIQIVQWAHFALRIPPAAGRCVEAGDLRRVHVLAFSTDSHQSLLLPLSASMRRRQVSARSNKAASSM
jgi:hypothetical protein